MPDRPRDLAGSGRGADRMCLLQWGFPLLEAVWAVACANGDAANGDAAQGPHLPWHTRSAWIHR